MQRDLHAFVATLVDSPVFVFSAFAGVQEARKKVVDDRDR